MGETVVLRRYAQYVLDQLLVLVATISATLWGAAAAYVLVKIGLPGEVLYLPLVLFIAVPLCGTVWSEVWMPHRSNGATPAMRRLGLRIVRIDGGEPRLRDYVVRWLLFAVDGLFMGLLGAVLIAVTPRNQRLGDIVTRTVVVRLVDPLVPEDEGVGRKD